MKRVSEYLDMLLEAKDDGQKKYHVFPHQVGKTRNIVDFHDGVKKHKDGSEFWDMRSFSRKTDMESFVKELIAQGYRESKGPLYEGVAPMSKETAERIILTAASHRGIWGMPKSLEYVESHLADMPEPVHRALKVLKGTVSEGRAAEGLILHSDDGRFKYSVSKSRETGEWVAKAYLDGKYDEDKTIYETDRESALASAKSDMARWNKLNPGVKTEADESSGPEPAVISQLRKIVDESQAGKVTDPKTGKKVTVDGTTAAFIVKVWDKLPMKYREGFETRIIPMGIHAMASFAFKVTGK